MMAFVDTNVPEPPEHLTLEQVCLSCMLLIWSPADRTPVKNPNCAKAYFLLRIFGSTAYMVAFDSRADMLVLLILV